MRQNNFDFLRFYFAFIVVIGHIIDISGLDIFKIYSPFFNTYISVTAFFCISGFLISSSYVRNKSFKQYLKKRVKRILPPYILVILLSAFLLYFISYYSFNEYFTNPQFSKYLLANLTFLNFLEPCLPGVFTSEKLIDCSVNGALWTLKIEVAFYLILPVLLYFIFKFKRKYIFLLLIYILAVCYKYFFSQLSIQTGNRVLGILTHQLPGFMSYFVCGIALYFYFNFFIRHKKYFFLIGIILFVFEKIVGWEIFTPFALSSIIFYFAYSFKFLNSFGKYGDISYGIYIYHCPIIKLITDFGFYEKYNPYLVSFILVIMIIIVGFISWNFMEKNF